MTLKFKPAQIPMTPDKTLLWEINEIQSGGVLIHPAGCNTHIIDTLLYASQNPTDYRAMRNRIGTKLGSGVLGDVYRQQVNQLDIAIKLFFGSTHSKAELHGGLSGIRANVAIAEGIRRLTADKGHVFTAKPLQFIRGIRYALKTPTYYAAVLYPDAKSGSNAWAMSFESGTHARSFSHQPPYDDYTTILNNACTRVELMPRQVNYDTRRNIANLLLRPSKDPYVHTDLVKIDSYAKEPLNF